MSDYLSSLTPEQIQMLYGSQFGPNWTGSFSQGGVQYDPMYQESVDDPTNRKLLGFTGTTPDQMKAGGTYTGYGTGGDSTGMHQYEKPGMKDFLVPALAIAGMMGLPGGALSGMFGGGAAGGSGAFLGEGVSSGIPAWDAAAGYGAEGVGGGGGLAFDGGGDLGAVGGGAGGASSGGGYLEGSSAGMAAPAASDEAFLQATTGLPSWARTALTLGGSAVGGLLGSHPVQKSEVKAMDPQMQPYVYGQGGLLPGAAKLFQQQTAPGALPGFAQEQAVGQGLLNQPIAGNGYAQFQARPRFGAPR